MIIFCVTFLNTYSKFFSLAEFFDFGFNDKCYWRSGMQQKEKNNNNFSKTDIPQYALKQKNQLKKHFQKISASLHFKNWKYFSIFDKPHTLALPHIPINPNSLSHIFTHYLMQKLKNIFVEFQLVNIHLPCLKYSTFYI